jgi:hypothetical protein
MMHYAIPHLLGLLDAVALVGSLSSDHRQKYLTSSILSFKNGYAGGVC